MLLIGAVQAPGTRTATSILGICGFADERRSVNHHRILSRTTWRPRTAARLLLSLSIHKLQRAFLQNKMTREHKEVLAAILVAGNNERVIVVSIADIVAGMFDVVIGV